MPEIFDPSSQLLAVTTVLDQSPDSLIDQLQRAAIGPVNADYYRPILARFQTYDRGSPSWNWASCLCTLSWMAFRGMWMPALAYLGGSMLAIAALFAATRLAAPMASSVEWGLWAALATLAFLLPGFFGNTWLFGHYRLRLARALSATPTVVDACQLLGRQASSHRRLVLLVAANVLLALSLAALWLWPRPPGHESARVDEGNMHVQALPAPATQPLSAPTDNPTPHLSASAPSASASAAASDVMSASIAHLAAPRSAPGPASSRSAGTADTLLPEAATVSASITSAPRQAAPVPATATAASASPVAVAVAVAPDSPVSAPDASPTRSMSPVRAQATADAGIRHAAIASRSRKAHQQQTAPVAAASAPPGQIAASSPRALALVQKAAGATEPVGRYQINVGLFAQKDNARRTFERLRAVGLPATSQELQRGNDTVTRVRVGPFASRTQADAAAQKIRALQLDAMVIQP